MRRIRLAFLLSVIVFAAGCGHKVPEPQSWATGTVQAAEKARLTVRHTIDGRNLKVECIVPDASFHRQGESGAKVHIWINDQFHDAYDTAAFIISGLPTGTNKIKLKVIDPTEKLLNVETTFQVVIL